MNILIVDDSIAMRKILNDILNSIGSYQIHEAIDGNEALALLAKESIDLVMLDWNMPHLDGLDTLKAIRKSPQFGKVKVVMVTSLSGKKDILTAIQAGADNYITKPFSKEVIEEKLSEMQE